MVYVLLAIHFDTTTIVGVFSKHEDAVRYADEHKVEGWHVYERPLNPTR